MMRPFFLMGQYIFFDDFFFFFGDIFFDDPLFVCNIKYQNMHGLKFEVVKIQKANHHVHVAVTVPTLKKFKTQKSQNPKVKKY